MPVGPKTCLLPWRTAQPCCSLRWIGTESASVDSACCTSMTQARKGRGAGAACNCVEIDSRSLLTRPANGLRMPEDRKKMWAVFGAAHDGNRLDRGDSVHTCRGREPTDIAEVRETAVLIDPEDVDGSRS